VDPRFGRAKCFIAVDTETDELTVHDNSQNVNATQGAGIQAGRNVIDLGGQAVITGSIGPKAFTTLDAGGVKVYLAPGGTVAEALDKFKNDELECVSEANAKGRWS